MLPRPVVTFRAVCGCSEQNISSTSGTFELAVVGTDAETESELFPSVERAVVSRSSHGRRVLKYSFPFLVAHFGGITSCSKTKVWHLTERGRACSACLCECPTALNFAVGVQVVLGAPANGCGSFRNEQALANAIVIVERGGCRFTDKAMNVQTADAAAVIVVNDDGPAIRMPFSEDDKVTIHIPSLMVSQVGYAHRVQGGLVAQSSSTARHDVL